MDTHALDNQAQVREPRIHRMEISAQAVLAGLGPLSSETQYQQNKPLSKVGRARGLSRWQQAATPQASGPTIFLSALGSALLLGRQWGSNTKF